MKDLAPSALVERRRANLTAIDSVYRPFLITGTTDEAVSIEDGVLRAAAIADVGRTREPVVGHDRVVGAVDYAPAVGRHRELEPFDDHVLRVHARQRFLVSEVDTNNALGRIEHGR